MHKQDAADTPARTPLTGFTAAVAMPISSQRGMPPAKSQGQEDDMRPHITDHPRQDTPDRAAHYLAIARAAAPSRATLALQRRAAPEADSRRTAHFLRIARGRTA